MPELIQETQDVGKLKLLQRWEALREEGEEYKKLGRKITKLFKGQVEEIGDFKLEGEWIEREIKATTTEARQSRVWKMSILKKVGDEQIKLL